MKTMKMMKMGVMKIVIALALLVPCVSYAERNDFINFAGPMYPSGFAGINSTTYTWNGAALSNNVSTFRFDFQPGKTIRYARLICVWTPNSTLAGIQLIHMDDGPSNITSFGECPHTGQVTPIVSSVDITAQLNTLIANGVKKHIGWQSKSNGVSSPTIYKVGLEITYQD